MMNEIDAGPPNKKPKIGSNLGPNVYNGVNLTTQTSESSGKIFLN